MWKSYSIKLDVLITIVDVRFLPPPPIIPNPFFFFFLYLYTRLSNSSSYIAIFDRNLQSWFWEMMSFIIASWTFFFYVFTIFLGNWWPIYFVYILTDDFWAIYYEKSLKFQLSKQLIRSVRSFELRRKLYKQPTLTIFWNLGDCIKLCISGSEIKRRETLIFHKSKHPWFVFIRYCRIALNNTQLWIVSRLSDGITSANRLSVRGCHIN